MDPRRKEDSQDASDEGDDSKNTSPRQPVVKKRKMDKGAAGNEEESTDESYKPDETQTSVESDEEAAEVTITEHELVDISSDDVEVFDEDGLYSSDTDGITVADTRYKIRGLIYGSGGGVNTCTIDGFITALKIWFLRTKYDFVGNFKFTAPSKGYDVEQQLRRICHRVKVSNQDKKEIEHFEKESLELQKIWMEFELGPNHGRLPNEIGSTEDKVFSHLKECATFEVRPKCDCPGNPPVMEKKFFVFMRNQAEVMNFAHFSLFPGKKIDPANPFCRRCGTRFSSEVSFPDTTWMLRFKLSWGGNITDIFPDTVRLGGVTFRHALTIYQEIFARPQLAPRNRPPATNLVVRAMRDDPSIIAGGHESAVLTIKNRFYEYNDGTSKGLLKQRRVRQLKIEAWKKPVEVIYFRLPALKVNP